MAIRAQSRLGKSIRANVRTLGVWRNTVRRYLRTQGLAHYRLEPRATKLDSYKNYLDERVKAAAPEWIPAVVLFRELKRLGYIGGLTTLKLHLIKIKPSAQAERLIRFETEPGRLMQADFATIRRGADRLSVFIATLGWSRAAYVEFIEDEWLETLLAAEGESRRVRVREMFARVAGFPAIKTLDQYDFSFATGAPCKQIVELASLAFINARKTWWCSSDHRVWAKLISRSLSVTSPRKKATKLAF